MCGPYMVTRWGVTFRCWFTRRNWFWRRCGLQNLAAAGAHNTAVGLCNAAVPQCGRFLRFCLAAAASVGFCAACRAGGGITDQLEIMGVRFRCRCRHCRWLGCGGHGGRRSCGYCRWHRRRRLGRHRRWCRRHDRCCGGLRRGLGGLDLRLAAAIALAGVDDFRALLHPTIPVVAQRLDVLLNDLAADFALVLGGPGLQAGGGSPVCPRSPHSCARGHRP